jgi:dimethylargininase
MLTAILRKPARSLVNCELTYIERRPFDFTKAARQHAEYGRILSVLGADVVCLPAIESLPDSTFVEDAAVVLSEVAILANPGAESRSKEPSLIEGVLSDYGEIERITAPATIDGGDVLTIGKTCFVGVSSRTNRKGVEAFSAVAGRHGYTIRPIETKHSLHLKTAVTSLYEDTLIANTDWLDIADFKGFRILETLELFGGNVLRVGSSLVVHDGFERTNEMLEREGFDLRRTDISEFLKAEAGLTCLSLIFSR